MNIEPLVTVVCLCHNQGNYVLDALHSVLAQSYTNIELIVVDDGSADNSKEIINEFVAAHPEVNFIDIPQAVGNCKAFNKAFVISKGDFLIDLAADDILLPNRIAKGIEALQLAGHEYGVNFTDAELINEIDEHRCYHSDKFPHHSIPQGDIYLHVIQRYFICPPTVMFRRSVMVELGGYDESLTYEDFDFWIRSSRKYLYCYTPEVLVKKRIVRNSLSSKQFKLFNKHTLSTYRICKKIKQLNRTEDEHKALSKRLKYEMRLSARLLNFKMTWKYFLLWLNN